MGKRKYCHLDRGERHVLSAYLRDGLSLRSIGLKIGRVASGLCREIRENSRDGTRMGYEPDFAHMSAQFRKWDANRRNPLKSPEVMRYVLDGLGKEWSPVQISGRMKDDFPKNGRMRISHETVYRFISSDEGRGLGLVLSLRRGKARRHKRRKNHPIDPKIQCIPSRISIDDRPKTVASKTRYGDWESDSMIGKLARGEALSVQKERKSQVVRLRKVADKSASETLGAIIGNLGGFPHSLLRTMTFDNGRENTEHGKLGEALGLGTYFCDPYSSWQKGAVENAIGLIRQYIPKGSRLENYTDERIMEIQEKLNNRPRKCLGFKTPNEVLSRHLKKLGVQLPA